MHLVGRAGNDTACFLSIDVIPRHRMVVVYVEGHAMFKGQPDKLLALAVAKTGLIMIPLSKDTCERHMPTNSAPPPSDPPK